MNDNNNNNNSHSRRTVRKSNYDYASEGMYFITICAQNMRQYPFGKVIIDEMHLNDFGVIADEEWLKLPGRFPGIELAEFKVMPNHFHRIIIINEQIILISND